MDDIYPLEDRASQTRPSVHAPCMETTVFTGYISTPCGKDIHSKREAEVESGKSDLPEKEERAAKPMSEYYSDARDKEKARIIAGGREGIKNSEQMPGAVEEI